MGKLVRKTILGPIKLKYLLRNWTYESIHVLKEKIGVAGPAVSEANQPKTISPTQAKHPTATPKKHPAYKATLGGLLPSPPKLR